jgi:hypothetical protein
MAKRLTTGYRISFGNSTDGPIGGVIRLWARSHAEGLRKARRILDAGIDGIDIDGSNFRIYTNGAGLTPDDIEEDDYPSPGIFEDDPHE